MLDLLVNAPTEILLGGRTYAVRALTLAQLGAAQRWVRDHATRPAELVEAVSRHYPPAELRGLRREAAKAEADWPPTIGTEAGNRALLSSAGGLRCFLGLMLPGLTPDELDVAFGAVTQDDLVTLTSIAFTGLKPDPPMPGVPGMGGGGPSGRSRSPDYGGLFQDLLAKPPHWTHAQIASLTLPQIALLANDGKAPNPNRREFKSVAEAQAYLESREKD